MYGEIKISNKAVVYMSLDSDESESPEETCTHGKL